MFAGRSEREGNAGFACRYEDGAHLVAACARTYTTAEDAVAVGPEAHEPRPTRAGAPLDEDVRGAAGRRASPDGQSATPVVRDERELERPGRGLGLGNAVRVAVPVVHARLEPTGEARVHRVVADGEPGHERDTCRPHAVERLGHPALMQRLRH